MLLQGLAKFAIKGPAVNILGLVSNRVSSQ